MKTLKKVLLGLLLLGMLSVLAGCGKKAAEGQVWKLTEVAPKEFGLPIGTLVLFEDDKVYIGINEHGILGGGYTSMDMLKDAKFKKLGSKLTVTGSIESVSITAKFEAVDSPTAEDLKKVCSIEIPMP